MSTIILV